jgi:class 3 adenylate cyclase
MAVPLKPPSQMTADCEGWLKSAGLAHLCELFVQESIDIDVLPDLTDQDLADIGVRLGDRRRFLKMQQASFGAATQDAKAAETSLPANAAAEAGDVAERRYLTVMFCDLVGSTRITASLDPEEVRRILREYRDRIAAEVKRFEGHVAQYLGDGVLAYFGWPRALEHSPARAVTAGLSIVRAVASIESPLDQPLAVRVGIATGLVVVGDFLSGSESEERTAIGDVVNIAARLQDVAKPGTVVIAGTTLGLLGGAFVTAEAGTFTLKGISRPVDVFEVTEIRDSSIRYENAREDSEAGEIIGRDAELLLVKRRWKQVQEGAGQVILLSGEPGIGKSRLTAQIVSELSKEPSLVFRFFSSPFHGSTALHPFIEHFTHAARIKPGDPPAEQLDKLEALIVAAGADVRTTVPYIAWMMSIPCEDRYGSEELTPMIRKARTFSALTSLLEAHARKCPVLIVLEDAHWLDPTSFEMFQLLTQTIPDTGVMLLVNHRPEFRLQWTDAGNLTMLSLQKLRREQVSAIVSRIAGGRQLPPVIIDMIVERADGIPLFVEELTRTVLESGVLKEVDGHLRLVSPHTDVIIPNTLRDSLAARLDRHPETREVAQIAACIGREFEFWLLRELTGKDADDLTIALEKLQKAELISRWGVPPEATYTFRHALVRDAAADGLLRSRRRQIHERIARTIEQKVPELAAAP